MYILLSKTVNHAFVTHVFYLGVREISFQTPFMGTGSSFRKNLVVSYLSIIDKRVLARMNVTITTGSCHIQILLICYFRIVAAAYLHLIIIIYLQRSSLFVCSECVRVIGDLKINKTNQLQDLKS